MKCLYTGVDQSVAIFIIPPYDPASQPQGRTSIKQAPCPKCRCEDYVCIGNVFRCSSCMLSRGTAALSVASRAQVNERGHLLCQNCNVANEYAETDNEGQYVCTGCKMMATSD